MARNVLSLELTLEHNKNYVDKFKSLLTDGAQVADWGQSSRTTRMRHKSYKKFSTDGAQGVFRAHDAAPQRLCGQVQRQHCLLASTLVLWFLQYDSKKLFASILVLWSLRQQKPWSSCNYFCFMIPTTVKGVVFLHLFFYDPCDSKNRGLSCIYFCFMISATPKPWSSCICFCFMIPTTQKP